MVVEREGCVHGVLLGDVGVTCPVCIVVYGVLFVYRCVENRESAY